LSADVRQDRSYENVNGCHIHCDGNDQVALVPWRSAQCRHVRTMLRVLRGCSMRKSQGSEYPAVVIPSSSNIACLHQFDDAAAIR
jgi:hypothetical protein